MCLKSSTNSILIICGFVCRAGSVISDTTFALDLGQEEWVSFLKLSTIWNMEKVCLSSLLG